MKITKLQIIKANRGVYCKIHTDEGITGLGESGAWGFHLCRIPGGERPFAY